MKAALTAALISVNWAIYVWSIQNDQALEAALGYYINPLFSVFLGAVLLKERLSRPQWAAIALAALAVLVLTYEAGRVPFVALGLTVSWGIYAYLKKRLPLGPNQGFMLEVLILSPLAIGWVVWIAARGEMVFLTDAKVTVLLLLAGVVTAVPLMLYANGAKLLRLSTIGILQYIAPSVQFIIALAMGEPFTMGHAVTFGLIWIGVITFTLAGRQPSIRVRTAD